MRTLLFGANGQVGHELTGPLSTMGELVATRRADCDITDRQALERTFEAATPDLVVNATAYNAVDGAEGEPELAHAVNEHAVRAIGELATQHKAGVIHLSTDYVFSGDASRPYIETDRPAPLGVYGASKLAGEIALLDVAPSAIVFRTSWVFSRRPCFLTKMMALAASRDRLAVADDQVSSPTFARDLAQALALFVFGVRADPAAGLRERRGVYHLAGGGHATRCAFVREAVRCCPETLAVKRIDAVPATTFPTAAERPAYSALDGSRAKSDLGIALPAWQDAIRRMFAG